VDSSGKAGARLPTSMENGGLKFRLSPKDHTAYYLLERKTKAGKED
jgi:hypothetical protein